MIDFDTFLLGLIAAAFLFTSVGAIRKLQRGSLRWGNDTFTRTDHPAEFWFFTLVTPVALVAFGLEVLVDRASGATWTPNLVLPLWLSSTAGFWLVRALQTQRVGIAAISFARAEEPREYWLLVLLYAVAALALPLWFAARA